LKRQGHQESSGIRPGDWSWPFWPVVPLYPYGKRRTLRKEVVKDTIWTFDQLQGILYVVVPIRMTVVKLVGGGLLAYAPVAPTRECIRLVKELVAEHGKIQYIILPTVSGIEHKVFVGPFARRFPEAQVFVAPSQWSFPIDLPLSWLGLPWGRTEVLPEKSADAPFADQFDYAVLGPIELGLGRFAEVALFHKSTGTLLVTDSILSVSADPPAILQLDPAPLLFHARDNAFDVVQDNASSRLRGWQRIALFAFYFRPSALEVMGTGQAIRDAWKAPNRSMNNYFGLYPFQWKSNWQYSFEALRGKGRLLVAPVLQTLILNRGPRVAIAWADRVSNWDFQRLIPCHFDSPIATTPQQFRQAFTFLEKYPAPASGSAVGNLQPLPEEDFKVMKAIETLLTRRGITPPAQEKV